MKLSRVEVLESAKEALTYLMWEVSSGQETPGAVVKYLCQAYWPGRPFEIVVNGVVLSSEDEYEELVDLRSARDADTGEIAHDLLERRPQDQHFDDRFRDMVYAPAGTC
jgi:hypothetical protein